jgi:hypothetical protein
VKKREDDLVKNLEDAETPLYPDCIDQTKLSAITALYNLKCETGLSDNGFDKLLALLQLLLPKNNVLPKTIYDVKKFLKVFDMGFEKIHACKNDCCLFRNEYQDLDSCPKCNSSRWKINDDSKEIMLGVPAKVLRYFPIIPRFRRMYRSQKMAEDLRWHFNNKSNDEKMRHPVDSVTWNVVDERFKSFSSDPRNLRLGLATDGVNPFGSMSSKYSCWPVMLVTYNLSPMLCMKKENIMLTLLIPGPKQPGNDIDVYLAPLIEDLNHLWNNGIDIYDAFSRTIFNLRAILLWTINDFPAYGNLAGCCVKGEKGCPLCGVNTHHRWLKHSRKIVYMGHRRFLDPSHPWRKQKTWFDNTVEKGSKPRILTGRNISVILKGFPNVFGKDKNRETKKRETKKKLNMKLNKKIISKKRKSKHNRKDDEQDELLRWKKRSIFFDLPYWEVSI